MDNGEKVLQIFGKRLRDFRTQKGLSQEQLSALTDLDRSYISDVERGLRNISLKNIDLLANAMGVPVYFFFVEEEDVLRKWDIELSDLNKLILGNPSLRGFMIGYLAESKLLGFFAKDRRITKLIKFDDHDRNNKHDLVVTYKGKDYTFEIKSLQTSTVKQPGEKSIFKGAELEARFQCDASDRRKIKLSNGDTIETTCLRCGEFGIVAINLFAFKNKWEFAFALNCDLPLSEYKKYPEEVRKQLIKSIIPISYPIQAPFVSDPFILLEALHQQHARS